MRIRTAVEIGILVRQTRAEQAITQDELALRVGVNRKWISELENGKETAQLALALRTLNLLGLALDAVPSVYEGAA